MKKYFKRLWNAIWDSTDIDEKAEAALKETKTKHGKEEACHHWFNYKWGFYPTKNLEDYKICKR